MWLSAPREPVFRRRLMLYFDSPSRTHNDVTVFLVAVGLYLVGALR